MLCCEGGDTSLYLRKLGAVWAGAAEDQGLYSWSFKFTLLSREQSILPMNEPGIVGLALPQEPWKILYSRFALLNFCLSYFHSNLGISFSNSFVPTSLI